MKKKSVFWGSIFILLAIYLIISKLDLIPKLPIFSILITVVLLYIIAMGIRQLNFAEIFIPLALIGCQYDEFLHIEQITPWALILASVLLAIGFDMIFKSSKKKNLYTKAIVATNQATSESDGSEVHIESSFSGDSKYINSPNLVKAEIENSFGQCNVYFDNACLAAKPCPVYVENSFGETNLYFPHTWRVSVNPDCAFGDVKMHGMGNHDMDAPYVEVHAEVAFGTINVYFN